MEYWSSAFLLSALAGPQKSRICAFSAWRRDTRHSARPFPHHHSNTPILHHSVTPLLLYSVHHGRRFEYEHDGRSIPALNLFDGPACMFGDQSIGITGEVPQNR